jgi:hypothetical protein
MKLSGDTCRDSGFATTTFAVCESEDCHTLLFVLKNGFTVYVCALQVRLK